MQKMTSSQRCHHRRSLSFPSAVESQNPLASPSLVRHRHHPMAQQSPPRLLTRSLNLANSPPLQAHPSLVTTRLTWQTAGPHPQNWCTFWATKLHSLTLPTIPTLTLHHQCPSRRLKFCTPNSQYPWDTSNTTHTTPPMSGTKWISLCREEVRRNPITSSSTSMNTTTTTLSKLSGLTLTTPMATMGQIW